MTAGQFHLLLTFLLGLAIGAALIATYSTGQLRYVAAAAIMVGFVYMVSLNFQRGRR